jgi:hypothetical protein
MLKGSRDFILSRKPAPAGPSYICPLNCCDYEQERKSFSGHERRYRQYRNSPDAA